MLSLREITCMESCINRFSIFRFLTDLKGGIVLLKWVLIILFAATEVILIGAMLYCKGREKNLGWPLRLAFTAAFGAVFFYGCALLVLTETAANIFCALYLACFTWTCAMMLRFIRTYMRVQEPPKAVLAVVHILLTADCISVLLNPILGHAYHMYSVYLGGLHLWTLAIQAGYIGHMVLCYGIVAAMLACLIRQLIGAPRLYRMQNLTVCWIIIGVVVLNALFSLTKFPLDFSVLGFGAAATLICYLIFYFLPRRMIDGMYYLVLNDMESAALLFNRYGECIYVNRYAKAWFGLENSPLLCDFETILQLEPGDTMQDFRRQQQFGEGDTAKYYQTRFERLQDQKKRYMGCFFVIDDVTETVKAHCLEQYRITHDELTGLYNRQAFMSETKKLLKKHPDDAFCLIVTNIQQFKLINDMIGKSEADHLLVGIGRQLQNIGKPDIVAGRLESDHFVICTPKKYCVEKDFCTRFVAMQRQKTFPIAIVNHFGVYEVTDRAVSVEVMCERALLACGSLRGNAQRRVAYYDSRMRSDLLRENEMTSQFPLALAQKQFVLYFQPQYDYHTGTIVGAEALVRWKHPALGLLAPGAFVPLFERNGLIPQMDFYCWDLACQVIQKLHGNMPLVPISISVNISTRDFYAQNLYAVFTGLVKKYDIPPQSLKLEITESVAMLDVPKQRALLSRLQKAGFLIEMDDFGSGYSSLNTLKDIPVDVLKMDLRFLDDSPNDAVSQKILRTIIGLSQWMQIPVIAEGVETQEQADRLGGMGCRFMQGYHYAKPMPLQEFVTLLQSAKVDDLNRIYQEEQNAWTGGFYQALLEKQCRQYDTPKEKAPDEKQGPTRQPGCSAERHPGKP